MLLVEQLPFNFATIFFSIIGYVSELLIHRPKLVEVVVAVVNSQVYISQLSDLPDHNIGLGGAIQREINVKSIEKNTQATILVIYLGNPVFPPPDLPRGLVKPGLHIPENHFVNFYSKINRGNKNCHMNCWMKRSYNLS